MKSLVALVLSVFIVSCTAEDSPPPTLVQTVMQSMYPRATEVDVLEIEGGFEVDFMVDDASYQAFIDAKGNWVETEQEISLDDVPGNILQSAATLYPDYTVVDADAIQSAAHGQVYELEFNDADGEDMEVIFNVGGDVVRVEHEESDDGDEDASEYEDGDSSDTVIE